MTDAHLKDPDYRNPDNRSVSNFMILDGMRLRVIGLPRGQAAAQQPCPGRLHAGRAFSLPLTCLLADVLVGFRFV
jgi:hypothetical protein